MSIPNTKKIQIGLLSHYFQDDNLGCVALSISNMLLLDQAARSRGITPHYRIIVNEKHPEIAPPGTESTWEYRYFDSSKRAARHPIRYIRNGAFDGCHVVFNLNAGDGFTDTYGRARLLSESYMSILAQRRGIPLVVAPQTIGPFEARISKMIARRVLAKSNQIFTRDVLSTDLCQSYGLGSKTEEVIDVAFALPFRPINLVGDKVTVGVNVSGLLYRGGYDRKNYFNLSFDYKDFVHRLVAELVENEFHVHLIGHVLGDESSVEDDYSACETVAGLFPDSVVAPRFADPIEAKSYIASLDFFTGARMHSTIAAFSSGVPVVPIGYSRKLNGLYDTLGYQYYIDGKSTWTAEGAANQVVDWAKDRNKLRQGMAHGVAVYGSRLQLYREVLGGILEELAN